MHVKLSKVRKAYGKNVVLNDINMVLEKEKIYGLVGRNGAGKTTLLKIIAAQLFPSEGTVQVNEENPFENEAILSQLCFVKESQTYPDHFTVKDILLTAKATFPLWDETFCQALVARYNVPVKLRMRKLSRGMRSVVGVIIGLASRAPLTIFDEPYLGMDAVARQYFYDQLLADYADHPRTIILSTHLIDEVSELLEHVIVVKEGRILMQEDVETLRAGAVTVTGEKGKVAAFIQQQHVLSSQTLGNVTNVMIFGTISRQERLQAEAEGLSFSAVSLQKVMVHLTDQEKGSA
ncbi:ABC transporter [Fictibacillus macauensis ZFHKF-1]|uniref:ABC transporter n=1 Tax=Fictibacillus macauensis ZFHKF-1 TaxID=1196324 RepID=I8UBZ5_9BACL|nr:ATP-binding cassette domain-containing protein [Fictibacillus macauensis]EIT84318.1 ABC transporter [Fictibacillus macauensis ZFHKF-1]